MSDESIRELYPDAVDVTEKVEHYQNGKTFECVCGQGFGVEYGESTWKCPGCQELIIDAKAGEREPPSKDDKEQESSDGETQSNLESFF